MENEEMLEQTNEETFTGEVEENEEGIELTDTVEEEPSKKTLREILRENPEYQEELTNEIIKPRLDRKEREFNKKLSKFRRTRDLLGASFNSDDIDYINSSMENYLIENGLELPTTRESNLSDEEYEILGNAEAEKIISLGEDVMIEELNKLKEFKAEELSPKEKYVYKRLYEKLDENKKIVELQKEGIDLSILEDNEFNNFKKKFSKDTSLLEIVNMYNQFNNTEPAPAKIGSQKSNTEKGAKEFYSEKEIANLTMEDLDKPGVFEAVRRSMTKNKK